MHQGKRFVPAFSRSIDQLMDNLLSLEKEIIVLEQVWKKFRILDPKICTTLSPHYLTSGA